MRDSIGELLRYIKKCRNERKFTSLQNRMGGERGPIIYNHDIRKYIIKGCSSSYFGGSTLHLLHEPITRIRRRSYIFHYFFMTSFSTIWFTAVRCKIGPYR